MAGVGPRLLTRDRTRLRLAQGVVRKRVSKGVMVDIDVSPMLLHVADGLGAACQRILEVADPNVPDDPATPGSRIRESGQFGVYAFGQVMAVEGSARDFRKPRGFRPTPDGVDAVVTFRSRLHHLHEMGTVHMDARPYQGPAKAVVTPEIPRILAANFPKDGPGR